MELPVSARRLSRRVALKLAMLLSGALVASFGRRTALAGRSRVVFVLDPEAELSASDSTCAGCNACRRHAEHKRFASAAAADAGRAHPNCRCGIKAVLVSRERYEAYFRAAGGGRRETYDLRWSGGLEMPADRAR